MVHPELFASATGTLLVTSTDGVALYATPSMQERTGFDVPEIIGKDPGELWGGSMSKTFYQRMWKGLRTQNAFVDTVTNTKKGGETVQEELHIVPVYDQWGTLQYYIELQTSKPLSREELSSQFFNVKHAIGWMLSELGGDSAARKYASLAAFFEEECVVPMREQLHERQVDGLLVRLAQDDPSEFAALFNKYYQDIFLYFAARFEGHEQQAEDYAQEVFAKAFAHLPSFRTTNASYKTYLLRIAHNLLVNSYRKTPPLEIKDTFTHQTSAEITIDVSLLQNTISRLPQADQDCLHMKYIQGYSIREIAEEMHCSENAIKLRLSRARKKLRQELSG